MTAGNGPDPQPQSEGEASTDAYYELVRPEIGGADEQLLYHYTRPATAVEAILANGTLRLNPYHLMRDPLENKELPLMLRYASTGPPDRLPLRRAQEIVSDLRRKMRLLSLTMDSTGYENDRVRVFGRGYARPRMWEQYAQRHEGVCLAFSSRCLTGPFLERLQRYGATNIGPVVYTEGGFVVSEGRLLPADELTDDNAPHRITRHLMKHNQDYWFLKLLDWETELEYRFVLFAPDLDDGVPLDVPFGDCLRAIILGEKFSSANVPAAAARASELRVPLLRLEWTSGRPSITTAT